MLPRVTPVAPTRIAAPFDDSCTSSGGKIAEALESGFWGIDYGAGVD